MTFDMAEPEKFVNRWFLTDQINQASYIEAKSMDVNGVVAIRGKDAAMSLKTATINITSSKESYLGAGAGYLVSVIIFSTSQSGGEAIDCAEQLCRLAGLDGAAFSSAKDRPESKIDSLAKRAPIQETFPDGVKEKFGSVEIRAEPLSISQFLCVLKYSYERPLYDPK